uniref:Uncharacterized protein n=1 Tax=Rhizophagus irregularis (strain DAOM 181602 / DAOM 197198 / MUCL 43194) TaxID=747089 RepID=U9T2X7_RHIID
MYYFGFITSSIIGGWVYQYGKWQYIRIDFVTIKKQNWHYYVSEKICLNRKFEHE